MIPHNVKAFLTIALVLAPFANGQTFSSTSNGSDGALSLTTPGTVLFDPKTFNPPLDADGDGIYHFTTITIAAGVTVRLRGDIINTPVIWLAQGAVQINGTIDASGQDSFNAASTTQRTLTLPGAGGFGGGYPGVGGNPPGAGLGPGGGATACPISNTGYARPGGFTGNQFLVPLIGGSGGGARTSFAGGAGGGALLIASSVSITGTGGIKANGGARVGGDAEIGSGGAIRLVAPTVTISGNLTVARGNSYQGGCGPIAGTLDGIIRIEAFQIGAINSTGPLYTATPFGLFLTSAGIPSLRVVSIGGSAVAPSPTGAFVVPDVTVNSNAALPVIIEGKNVPEGTIVTLTIFSENGPDQTIQSSPLAGNLAASTATANVTLPSGFSKGFVKATFTQ